MNSLSQEVLASGWPGAGRAPVAQALMLLVDSERSCRARLQRSLTGQGFTVTGVGNMRDALEVAARTAFTHAVVEMRLPDGHGLSLLRKLLQVRPGMRVVIHTDFDSFASVVLALRAGATGYLTKPATADELIEALHGTIPPTDSVPDMPLGVDRLCWEYVHRIFEQCERNVSRTAKMLGMHRRTLQRMLGKRAPRLRAAVECSS